MSEMKMLFKLYKWHFSYESIKNLVAPSTYWSFTTDTSAYVAFIYKFILNCECVLHHIAIL